MYLYIVGIVLSKFNHEWHNHSLWDIDRFCFKGNESLVCVLSCHSYIATAAIETTLTWKHVVFVNVKCSVFSANHIFVDRYFLSLLISSGSSGETSHAIHNLLMNVAYRRIAE